MLCIIVRGSAQFLLPGLHFPSLPCACRCAVITEYAREQLAQKGVRIVVPGEKERVVVCLSDDKQSSESQETTEQQQQRDGENENEMEKGESGDKTEEESLSNASVGERCEVGMGGEDASHT